MNKKRIFAVAAILLLVLLIIALWLLFPGGKQRHASGPHKAIETENIIHPDTSTDSSANPVGTVQKQNGQSALKKQFLESKKKKTKSVPAEEEVDTCLSAESGIDTAHTDDTILPSDTIPPYVYSDYAGGYYDDTVFIHLIADEPCSIYYKGTNDFAWIYYHEPIVLWRSEILSFYAIDSFGNESEKKVEEYDIHIGAKRPCPKDMVFIREGGFCVDRYEWPNRKGAVPQTMVSFYAAKDSCYEKGKRLCSSQEWFLACAGPSAYNYAYGNRYEKRACNSVGKTQAPSGSFPECRSYYGAMDMNGNLREWTGTKAPDNDRFYKVHGGFWDSHVHSKCGEYQYSFYPQNSHLSVGFRCCKDVNKQKDE